MDFDYLCLNHHPELSSALHTFFQDIVHEGYDEWFHPHPLSSEQAVQITTYPGKDLYYGMMHDNKIVGYGMLRGWDEGYDVPSLGIAIHPLHAKKGVGKIFMDFLHFMAKSNKSKAVRLTVYKSNIHAVNLYSKLGYQFTDSDDGEKLIGILDLTK